MGGKGGGGFRELRLFFCSECPLERHAWVVTALSSARQRAACESTRRVLECVNMPGKCCCGKTLLGSFQIDVVAAVDLPRSGQPSARVGQCVGGIFSTGFEYVYETLCRCVCMFRFCCFCAFHKHVICGGAGADLCSR